MSDLKSRRVGFLGAGAPWPRRWPAVSLAAGVPARQVRAADPDAERRRLVSERLGIAVSADNAEAVAESDL